jgi:hypothetical protein
VESLLKDAPAPADDAASAAVAMPVAAPVATTGGEGQENGQENGQEKGMASWLGVLLMALGAAALLSSSRTVRHALGSVRWPGSSAELPVVAHAGQSDPAFAPERIRFVGAGQDELLRYEPRSTAPLARGVRTRPAVAPEPPAQEAFLEEGIGALAALAGPVTPDVFAGRRATCGVKQPGALSRS